MSEPVLRINIILSINAFTTIFLHRYRFTNITCNQHMKNFLNELILRYTLVYFIDIIIRDNINTFLINDYIFN